jgi:nicotinate-nucleotide adenylyltransferase
MNPRLPMTRPDQRIGLLGGSFDPAHSGHVQITLEALKRFDLDQVWWLVSPGNPLKTKGPAPLQTRLNFARQIMQHPRVHVTGIEATFQTRYTVDTLDALQAHAPMVHFCWLMGADNMASIHHWDRWPQIFHQMPVGVLARPGSRQSALHSPAARRFRASRVPATTLMTHAAPAWSFVNVPMSPQSSTAIRRTGAWG